MADISQVPLDLRKAVTYAITKKLFPVYLFGGTGVGKTCMSALVYETWPAEAGWMECDEVLRAVAATRVDPLTRIPWTCPDDGHKGFTDLGRFWSLVDRCGLLCIDDLGVRPPSEAQRDILLEILNRRKGKATIITGNLEPHKLAEVYDGRIQSRCNEGRMIRVKGTDQRTDGNRIKEVQV
jgi:DNA replication protein DnaC